VYPAKDASDHEEACPDKLVECVCGEKVKRQALGEHMMKDPGPHMVALMSRLHRAEADIEEASEQKRRRDGEPDTDCKRLRLEMEVHMGVRHVEAPQARR
jgi:hypothetical protein